MRLLIILPKQQTETGNSVTARRLQEGLEPLEFRVDLLQVEPDDIEALRQRIETLRPDRLLLLHAWRSGAPWLPLAGTCPCPATVLLTGTDVNHDIDDPHKGPVVRQVLMRAAAIVCQNRLLTEQLQRQHPEWRGRLQYIAPGVRLGAAPYPLRRLHGLSEDCVLFLHPAGVRPVKQNLELLQLCDPLAAAHPQLVVAFCGPLLDPAYADAFLAAVAQRSWARYLGVIPVDAMPAALAEADLVLNHSRSEGLSNALLEALAVGRPVLARNIPGNAALADASGLLQLYDDSRQFTALASAVLKQPRRKIRSLIADALNGSEARQFAQLFRQQKA